MTAASVRCLPPGAGGDGSARTRGPPCSTWLPAFLVMGIITFYPLLFQTWMSFTDFQLSNLSGKVPRQRGRARQLRPRSSRAS